MSDKEALEQRADELNASLLVAQEIFRETFKVPAQIDLPSGAVLKFKIGADGGFTASNVHIDCPAQDLMGMGLQVRAEAAKHIEALWVACETAQRERIVNVIEAIQSVRDFIGSRR